MGRAQGHTGTTAASRRGGGLAAQLQDMTPEQVDERWAQVLVPVHRALAALLDTERSIRRYRKSSYSVPSYLSDRQVAQQEELARAREAEAPFEVEFERRGGWTRYFLVANHNGHLHRAHCSTLRPGKTMVTPVYELSGADDSQVVDRMKHTACTVCFPEAPVAAAAPAVQYCPGSNTAPAGTDFRRRYATCEHCGQSVSLTAHSGLRKHKPRA